MIEHPWATRAPGVWRAASASAALLVAGLLLTLAVGVPPLLPAMLAGASRIAVRAARGLPVDPIGDAAAGVREDTARFAVLIVAVALAVAIPGWVAGVALDGATGVAAGVRLALGATCVAVLPVVAFGAVLATATTTRAPSLPAVAAALAVGHARTSVGLTLLLVASLVPLLSPAAPALLPISLGVGFSIAARLAWRVVLRSS